MCQDDTDGPTQGHPHPHADILQKNEVETMSPLRDTRYVSLNTYYHNEK